MTEVTYATEFSLIKSHLLHSGKICSKTVLCLAQRFLPYFCFYS